MGRNHVVKPNRLGYRTWHYEVKRLFTKDQKDALWWEARPRGPEGAQTIKCPKLVRNPNCYGRTTYEDCIVDHRHAYANGGVTEMGNAQLLCKSCNAVKRDN